MDKETRNAIERATQRARKILEEDFSAQLEGDFDVHPSGEVAAKAGPHLSRRQTFQREKIVAAIEHKRAAGMEARDAVADYLRDAAFTTLNRFVALKMLEARELVQECITRGEQSSGYREFCGLAPGLPLLAESAGYRLYIESLFDELSTEVKVLFDRRDPSSVLWPRRATFEQLFETLNADELGSVWGEDETIGWVYQFFNGQDERRKMREESQAPRNSRELAVRNQFFTPRYVVQFLTENTLGRIWYEMRGTKTVLAERCEYMVRKPGEEFAPRAKKDPRDLRVLDPACGSGHFLLYAFDLLLMIYEEAYSDPESPQSEATGRTIAEDYASLDALRRAIPGLILAQNLHGVDIDRRCAQIAQLALWMRAQRAYRDFSVPRSARSVIRRSCVVIAEPIAADAETRKAFHPDNVAADVVAAFDILLERTARAGELGLLLRLESLVGRSRPGDNHSLFAPSADAMRDALEAFAATVSAGVVGEKKRLFADDAAHGIGLFELTTRKFDAIVMNPPFGDAALSSRDLLAQGYPTSKHEICAVFLDRSLEMLTADGIVGVISTRLVLFNQSLADWRQRILTNAHLDVVADFGHGVLDAMVETAAYTVRNHPEGSAGSSTAFVGLLGESDKRAGLADAIARGSFAVRSPGVFRAVPGAPLAYWVPESLLRRFSTMPSFLRRGGSVGPGIITGDDFRFFRLRWEIDPADIQTSLKSVGDAPERAWIPVPKGGEYQLWYDSIDLVLKWHGGGHEVRNFTDEDGRLRSRPQNLALFFRPGSTYPYRTTSALGVRLLPAGSAFSNGGWGVFPPEGWTPEQVTAVYNSRVARYFLEVLLGSGDSASSGTAARNYGTEAVGGIPWPNGSQRLAEVLDRVRELERCWRRQLWDDEDAESELATLARTSVTINELARAVWAARISRWSTVADNTIAIERGIEEAYGLTESERAEIAAAEGASLADLSGGVCSPAALAELFAMPVEQLVDVARQELGGKRFVVKKSYFIDRAVDLACQIFNMSPAKLLQVGRDVDLRRTGVLSEVATALLHQTLVHSVLSADSGVLGDDEGHPADIVVALKRAAVALYGPAGAALLDGALEVKCGGRDLRVVCSSDLFAEHLERFSGSRRKAPICWQLATPSGRYSVWCSLRRLSRESIFKVQNEIVYPKLAHEQLRLEAMRAEVGADAKARDRKALAEQEAEVEELRAFLDELKRIAPLWNPDLDDGVIINFAPLWRLVPHHRPWQKELKATWNALCDGGYDWAHLAMHLWPERVVPKCAKDRSLAIAHGLEEVFWVDGADRKWSARKTPTRSIEELVRERTSPAVKAALKSLLEAPAAGGNGARGRTGRRRSAGADRGDA